MYILQLNDMRHSKIERLTPVGRAETREALIAFLEREGVPGYRDGHWYKAFRQGGPLEWYNPPLGYEGPEIADVGTLDDHQAALTRQWEQDILRLPMLETV